MPVLINREALVWGEHEEKIHAYKILVAKPEKIP